MWLVNRCTSPCSSYYVYLWNYTITPEEYVFVQVTDFSFYRSNYFVLILATIYVRFVKFNRVNGGMVMDTGTWCRPLRSSERTERSHFAKQIF